MTAKLVCFKVQDKADGYEIELLSNYSLDYLVEQNLDEIIDIILSKHYEKLMKKLGEEA
ncbi:hypothetical protein V6M85_13975 (plasmid) [Sulfolobus tengchongensis]|uniref:Uncharacterized protein n=1 Tax=Sulfolobus tengchongensis TaxID=207809 RepID=A0AAX4L4Z7_9CREN